MEILDSHFHILSMKKRNMDLTLPEGLIGIDVGTDPFDYLERKDLISEKIDYSHAAGPWCVARDDYKGSVKTTEDIKECFERFRGNFLGEIGLDYFRMYGTKEEQIALFTCQLDLADELSLPVIIHSRSADSDMMRIIKERSFKHSGIMHCFSSGKEEVKIALDKGLYISFAGNVTYKGNDEIREAAKIVPKDRILYETDSPYLSPMPLRGKACRPEYTDYTSSFLASIRGDDVNQFRLNAIENFKELKRL